MGLIVIPKVLREKLGEDGSEALIELMKEVDLSSRKEAIVIAEERFERRLTEEIAKINDRITNEVDKLRIEIERLRTEVEGTKASLIKWMFIFWVSQLLAIFSFLKFFLR